MLMFGGFATSKLVGVPDDWAWRVVYYYLGQFDGKSMDDSDISSKQAQRCVLRQTSCMHPIKAVILPCKSWQVSIKSSDNKVLQMCLSI
jgi:hypothetical protein